MLYKNEINVSMADSTPVPPEVSDALLNAQRYFYQTPNKKILWVPLYMRIYCLTNPKSDNWWSNFWRSQGEPPVVYDPKTAQRTASQLAKLLKTKGCFNSTVTTDTVHRNASSVIARYNIRATQRYKIDEVRFSCRHQADINDSLQKWKGDSYLKVGDYYDQEKMTLEQTRIATNLKNKGFYNASADMVRFRVDTTYDSRNLSILVYVRLPQIQTPDSVVQMPLQKYRIDNIYIYPNISTAIGSGQRQFDTLIYPYTTRIGSSQYKFVYDKKISPSPRVISRSMHIFNGMSYRPSIVNNTSASLLGLHNFKYVDINFTESPNSTDSNRLLDAQVRLLNSTRQRLSLSFELSNSSDLDKDVGNYLTNGNLGMGATLGYQNNNLFGGAELLNIEGDLLFDLPKNVFTNLGLDFRNIFSTFEFGFKTSLDLPDFLFPLGQLITWQSNKPHTLFEINTNYIYRNLSLRDQSGAAYDITLERRRIGSSFGYTWNHGITKHKLLPINLSYSHLVSGKQFYYYLADLTSDSIQFREQAHDYVLLNTHYEYTFSNQTIGIRSNFNYLQFSVETAGNLLNWADQLINGPRGQTRNDSVIYYQYLRFDSEFKRYIYIGTKSTLVLRALAGIALPYGHSQSIPYEKMFLGGGPTTMRGWQLRRLKYDPEHKLQGEYPFGIGVGEIQAVFNAEHRFPLVGIFEGAIFADIGNVWTCKDWGLNGGNKFDASKMAKSLAFDAGIGIRANISIVTLRIDIALPLYDPSYNPGQRWIHTNWDWNKIVTNFGINYPF